MAAMVVAERIGITNETGTSCSPSHGGYCMSDLSQQRVVEVTEVLGHETANELLNAGWILLEVGKPVHGLVKYVLGRPDEAEEICGACGGTKEVIATVEGQEGTEMAPCPKCTGGWWS